MVIDGALVLGERGFAAGSVLVEGKRIAAVAGPGELSGRAGEIVDARGMWLIPGLIDAHAHGYATLLRGTENSMPLELWALYTVLYGRAYDARAIRAAVLLGAAERIRAGITGWIDHTPMVPLAETALAAHEASGLRVGYAAFLHDLSDYDLMRLDLPPDLAAAAGSPPVLDTMAYAARFADVVAMARAGSGRVNVLLGPNAPQRCSPEAWALWRRLRDGLGVSVHTHLMETRAQAKVGAGFDGGLVMEMERQGMLDARLSVAHGIWLDPPERDRLARHGVIIAHNPSSNLMLGSGIIPYADSLAAGVGLALGTDSANTGGRHDLFEAMRLAMMLPRLATKDHTAWPRGRAVLDMATRQGAAVLGHADLGRIAPGCLADLVLIRHDRAATLAMAPDENALVQHASPDAVAAVMVDGRFLLRDGRVLAFDEAAALAEAADAIGDLRERTASRLPEIAAVIPALAARLAARG
jgi:cytosine/adenosine deaminase-related metal-dependent hydrolase